MRIHEGQGHWGEGEYREKQLQKLREDYTSDFGDQIAAYDQALIDNARIEDESRTKKTQLFNDFWQLFAKELSEEWQTTNSNMTYKGIIEDSLLTNELSGLTEKQKTDIKELGLTPHFFDELQVALGGCNPLGEVNNIIEQLRAFRGEQGKLLAILQGLQEQREQEALARQQEKEEEQEEMIAANKNAHSQDFIPQEVSEMPEHLKSGPEVSPNARAVQALHFELQSPELRDQRLGYDMAKISQETKKLMSDTFGIPEDTLHNLTKGQLNEFVAQELLKLQNGPYKLPNGIDKLDKIYLVDIQDNGMPPKLSYYDLKTGSFQETSTQDAMRYGNADLQVTIQRQSLMQGNSDGTPSGVASDQYFQ